MSDSDLLPGGAPPPLPNSWNPTCVGGCLAGSPLYVSAAGCVSASRSNALGTTYPVGFALHAALDGERVGVRFAGLLTLTRAQWAAVLNTGTELVPGSTYYVTSAIAGKMQRTAPTEGNYIASVGLATSAITMQIQITLATPA